MAVAAVSFVVIGLLSVAGKVMCRPVAMWLSMRNSCLTGVGPRRREVRLEVRLDSVRLDGAGGLLSLRFEKHGTQQTELRFKNESML